MTNSNYRRTSWEPLGVFIESGGSKSESTRTEYFLYKESTGYDFDLSLSPSSLYLEGAMTKSNVEHIRGQQGINIYILI